MLIVLLAWWVCVVVWFYEIMEVVVVVRLSGWSVRKSLDLRGTLSRLLDRFSNLA